MQDRYTADIGDFIKYGLLRALAGNRRLGVAWYLFPDEGHNSDGKHIAYLDKPGLWRGHDEELFDELAHIVSSGSRKVATIEKSGLLGDAVFHSECLIARDLKHAARHDWRVEWFEAVQAALQDCDIVFADPDNGLCRGADFKLGRVKHWKRLPLGEARTLATGRTAIFYHHNTRRPGGHVREIADWIEHLGTGTIALRWRAYSARTFFIVNPDNELIEKLEDFANSWAPKAELYRPTIF